MKYRIRRVAPFQAGLIAAVLYAILGLICAPIFALASFMVPDGAGFGIGFAIALPFLYGGVGFTFTALGAALYNLVAGWLGGLELELDGALAE